ncbi:hypothetical protein C8F01DRAFT_1102624 [Mycena amicta]|nr:hypothetical protein C8F01DRAFT_1102624 [Mycena amicta]
MILDDETASLSKLLPSTHPTLRLPEPVAGRSSVSLPDYETSQAQQWTAPEFRKPNSKLSFPTRFDTRFWRGTFFALAIYVFLSVVIGIPVIVTRIALRKSRPPPNIQSLFLDDSNAAGPFLPGSDNMVMAASSTQCDTWDSMGYSNGLLTASVRRILSPTGLFSVRSNATDEVVPRSGGRHNLTVGINDDASETNVVMSMTLSASSTELRTAAHFCFTSSGAMRGYSVYMPQSLAPFDYLAFDIRVLFPQSPKLLTPTDLITYLPMFFHSIGSLGPRVRIAKHQYSRRRYCSLIEAQDLHADKIAVKNSFAGITGTFNITQSLTLDNIEGPVHANVTLVNDPSTGLATYLVADTGNSDLTADVTMLSTSRSQTPHFNANVQTFNGSLTLNMTHDSTTPPASLMLQVGNNQAPSTISLDSKFTGSYDLRSKLAPVRIKHPHGMSANWHLYTDANSTSSARGWAGWGARPTHPGPTDSQVKAVSSLSPIVLHLGGGPDYLP